VADEITLTVKDIGKIRNLHSSKVNYLTVKTKFTGHVLDMEDVNFHFDSAVLLPDFGPFAPKTGTPEQNRITGLAVLYACYKHAQEDREKKKDEPEGERQRLLIAGHTDRKGGSSYNLELSNLRAENIRCALRGDKDGWVKVSRQKHQVEDHQQILKWVAWNWGWDCDPGEVNNKDNPETRAATKKFQIRYNVEFGKTIKEDGSVGKETWEAFFDMYMRELKAIMGVDDVGLEDARGAILFLDKKPPAVGCGENFPKSEAPHDCKKLKKSSAGDTENSVDRRVELLFFDPEEVPKLECHTKPGSCVPSKCDLYCGTAYSFEPIPVNPMPLPSGLVARVFLVVSYKDPEGANRPLPENLPVEIVFPDGTTQDEIIGREGKLTFQVERNKLSFTIRFASDMIRYFASPTSETTGEQAERFLFEPEVPAAVDDHYHVFKIPLTFSLGDSDWDVVGAATYTRPDFTQLENKTLNIGSEASRVQATLNPHWQYVKFLYFDRWIKQELNLPPLMIESFAGAAPAPVARSNWLSSTGCQCVPWIVQRTAVGVSAPMPDASVKLQFRTVASTFVEASGTASSNSRRLVTISSATLPPPSDIGLNTGQHLNFDVSTPRASRLRYYDLPPLWRSRTYFARLSGGTGNPPAGEGRFETLVANATTDSAPLMISLDDMVLTDETLAPIAWVPDTQVRNRVAIFANTFANTGPSSANLSTVGLYKADTGNQQPWFTQRPSVENTRNYVADYPQWTRAIITQGNLFSVFDRRTPDAPSGVVGARAAVRHRDVFASNQTFVQPGTQRPSAPAATIRPFATIHPLYEQLHDKFWTDSDTDDRGIGRFDLMLLRCCDVASDGVAEIAQVLNYFRFFFAFNPSFTPEGAPNAVPLGLTGTAAADWASIGIRNLLIRWNGPEGTHNPGPAEIRTPSSSSTKLHARSLWFAQDIPRAMAHYEMGIFKHFEPFNDPKNVRAYMSADRGEGALDERQNGLQSTTGSSGVTLSGTFTFAHETGHGGSLGDEYVEQTSPTSLPTPWLPGFDSFSPGAPFVFDFSAMMEANQQIRARYFWQVAEWMRGLVGSGVEFEVVHGTHTYKLPHHTQSPGKTFVNFPVAFVRNKEMGPHGRFDVFLYPLGDEEFSATLLPNRATPPVAAYDGMIVVVVKMEIDFDIDNNTTIHSWLSAVHTQLNRRFNNKFCVRGNAGGRAYQRALLQFAPRFRVDDYSATTPDDTREHITIDVPDTGVPEWDSGIIFVSRTKLFFPRNQPPNVFARFFGHMLGLADGTFNTPASYEPIARLVMPDASVQNV